MTSRKLLFNLVREDIKHRLYVLAINLLSLFFIYPVGTALMVSNARNRALYGTVDTPTAVSVAAYLRKSLTAFFVDFYGGKGVSFFLVMLLCFSVVTGFSWFAKERRTDYLHALPVKRNTLFFAFSLSSFLMTMLPCALFGLVSAVIASVGGGDAKIIFSTVAMAFLTNLPPLFLCFASSVLAMVLTGNIFVSILGISVFFCWGPGVALLVNLLFSTYFYSFCSGYYELILGKVVPYTSPVSIAITEMEEKGIWKVLLPLLVLAVGAAVFFLSLHLYRIRPSEAAGRAMAFRHTEAPVKIAIVVPSAIAGTLFMRSVMSSTAWGIFGFVFTLLLSHCVIEIIYHADFRKLFARKGQLFICFILSAAILCVFRFDIFGYDRFVPKKEDIISAGVFADELENNYYSLNRTLKLEDSDNYSDGYYVDTEDPRDIYQVTDEMEFTDTDALLRIASQGVEDTARRRKSGIGTSELLNEYQVAREEDTGADYYYGSVDIAYHLRNGKTVRRTYNMNMLPVREDLDGIHDSETFKNAIYPVLSMKNEELAGVNYQDVMGLDHVSFSNPAAAQKLLSVYKEELSSLTMETRRKEDPVLCLQFKTKEFQEMADLIRAEKGSFGAMNEVGYYPVYPSFTGTLALLGECGVNPRIILSGKGSERIRLMYTDYYIEEEDESGNMVKRPTSLEIEDEGEMDEIIMAAACDSLMYSNNVSPKYHGLSIRVVPAEDSAGRHIKNTDWELEEIDSDPYMDSYSMVFCAGRVPEFVMEKFMLTEEDVSAGRTESY
ncbi:MAG: DUF6449 domain-containing protein [Lachnospiraceae bacterium]|nr:DUF6449 domain-containing protein [Lachnospiraceae bacterium]